MKTTTIQVSFDTKALINEIKEKYTLGTHDNTVKTMALFISRNDLNLNQEYFGSHEKAIKNLEIRMEANLKNHTEKLLDYNKSFRNWMGEIEKTYLKPLNIKLGVLDKIADYDINKISEYNLKKDNFDNPLNSHLNTTKEVEEIKQDLSSTENLFTAQNQQNSEVKLPENSTEISELKNQNSTYKDALQKIIFNSEIEEIETMIGKQKKIMVNLSLSEWNYINSLI
ncbi:hypothetical protein KRE40_18590 [Elizabethkingia meningoseptica]|uniref:hypothetical protein n=1 Tax=Elizabethkingia meningoseptica TaxID=238 RepID=UPI0023B00171|nr:hypothetical protein [Elizabethkingia meningoseptica]MDE5510650.1 hypothetical protein [Elizabethkingia meningoseptica]